MNFPNIGEVLSYWDAEINIKGIFKGTRQEFSDEYGTTGHTNYKIELWCRANNYSLSINNEEIIK